MSVYMIIEAQWDAVTGIECMILLKCFEKLCPRFLSTLAKHLGICYGEIIVLPCRLPSGLCNFVVDSFG